MKIFIIICKVRELEFKVGGIGGGSSNSNMMLANSAMGAASANLISKSLNPSEAYSAMSSHAIEPAEDDGIDDTLGIRHLSSQRFTRNHRLLADVFNDFVVPDQRSIVTQTRIEQLKKQVHSLEVHQEKLEQELQAIDEKYETKKRKFLSASKEFEEELDKVLVYRNYLKLKISCDQYIIKWYILKLKEFSVTEEQKSQFYTKHYDQLQKQWKDYVENFTNSTSNRVNFCYWFEESFEIIILNQNCEHTYTYNT
jgi:hypothetical protein